MDGPIRPDASTLSRLHENHLFNVPFENLDVHFGHRFDLVPNHVFEKVVRDGRGGFCYELNSLFNWLLTSLGFNSRIISARIYTDSGDLGPEFDHMAILVEFGPKSFLGDVGFGDLFLTPLEISDIIQYDGRSYFKIEQETETEFILSMSSNGVDFVRKYLFDLRSVTPDRFDEPCQEKQTNPSSHFVKNTICTWPTTNGRLTLFNNKLIEKTGASKIEMVIPDDHELRHALAERFGITIKY